MSSERDGASRDGHSDSLVRYSVCIEATDDLIADLSQALAARVTDDTD